MGIEACPVCKHFACVCEIKRTHAKDCPYRIASSGAAGIECEHGRDCCPICDPCTCEGLEGTYGFHDGQ